MVPDVPLIEGDLDRLVTAELVANGMPLSTSAGAATFPADATSAELLLASADARQREDKAVSRSDRGVLAVIR